MESMEIDRVDDNNVKRILELAELKESDLCKITQTLHLSEQDQENSYQLLELNKQLAEQLKVDDCFSFRGDPQDFLVMCSSNETFEVKVAETSNSWILVENMKFHKETNAQSNDERILEGRKAIGPFFTYFEVRNTKPSLHKVLELLGPSSFKGIEYEKDLDEYTLFTFEQLESQVQASEEELRRAIENNLIVTMDGYLRLISFEYKARALTLMLDLIDENSWELDEIDKEESYDSLRDLVPEEVFDGIFSKYTVLSGRTSKDGTPLYRYIEEKTCKFLAQVLLAASPSNDYNEFMEAWRIGTPEKMSLKEEYLGGVAVVTWNATKNRKEVISFPEENLSENVAERFAQLFKVKSKWTLQEITPFVNKLATGKTNVTAVLTKNCRVSTVNEVRYYSSKYDV